MYEILCILIVLGMGAIFGTALTATIVVHPILTTSKKTTAIEVFKPFFDRTHIVVLYIYLLLLTY